MKHYFVIAREHIVNPTIGKQHNDLGLKALDGYGELIVDIPDGKNIDDFYDKIKSQLDEKYPGNHFTTFEFS